MKKERHKNSLKNLSLVKKPVIWNDIEFESLASLNRHLGYDSKSTYIWDCIRKDRPIKGHYVDYLIS